MTRSRRKKTPEECDAADVREAAVRLLARREYAVGELRFRLERRGFPSQTVDEVVSGLTSEGLVSDERFTEVFVHHHMERGDGPLKLRHGLRERGVSAELIERYLPDDREAWVARAEALRQRRFGEQPPGDRRDWLRQARYLQSRGYTSEQVSRVLDDATDAGA